MKTTTSLGGKNEILFLWKQLSLQQKKIEVLLHNIYYWIQKGIGLRQFEGIQESQENRPNKNIDQQEFGPHKWPPKKATLAKKTTLQEENKA